MVSYDSRVLQQFADSLFAKARNIVITYGILGLLIGGSIGLGASVFAPTGRGAIPMLGQLVLWIPTVMGLAVGLNQGQMKAFMLRLEAQRTLCQLQIEANTRRLESVLPIDQRTPVKG
jgi:hypothetical protein